MRSIPAGTKFRVTAGAGSASRIADLALGEIPEPKQRRGRMNKTEAAYAQILDAQQHIGQIEGWMFESVKFRLADKAWYTPDFLVMIRACGRDWIEIHEIKGHEREAAIVRWKACAEKFHRFRFEMIKRIKGEWVVTRDSWS